MSRTPLRIAAAVALIAGANPIHAAEREAANPAAYLQAFNDTCRRGFPDLERIAGNAAAQGWQESSIRPISGAADILSATLPRIYHKDGLMLFLTHPNGGEMREVCQITGSATTKLTGADVAAVVAPSLTAGQPTIDTGSDRDVAVWTVAPDLRVRAGIAIYQKTRTISISAGRLR